MSNTLVGGRYRLGDRLGSGSGGAVHRALDSATGEQVALKLIGDQSPIEEWRSGRRVVAPGVVRTLDLGRDDRRGGFVVQALAPGMRLDEWWKSRAASGSPPWAELDSVIEQVAAALFTIHRAGLVHLDLKPAHILVADPGPRATLVDLGLARPAGVPLDALTGTPHYVAPELGSGAAPRGSADLFGLGACLYHVLSGSPPHEGADSRAILTAAEQGMHRRLTERTPISPLQLRDIPGALDETVEGLLSPDPEQRRGALPETLRAPAALAPLVGRAAALEQGADWLAARAGGLLRVLGEPHSGRSRALSELAALARESEWRVLEVSGEEPWGQALTMLERWSAELGLEESGGMAPDAHAPWEAVHAHRLRRIGERLEALSTALRGPLLLAVDAPDDPEALDLIDRSWRDAGFSSAALAAVCSRGDGGSEIRVEPLDAAETAALVAQIDGSAALRDPAIEQLRHATRGQPGALLALARRLDLRALALATDEEGARAIAREAERGGDQIMDLLADLDAETLGALEAVSVLDRPARDTLLHEMLDRPLNLERRLIDLEARGLLVRHDDGRVELGSETLARLLGEELGKLRAQRLHQKILGALGAGAPIDQRAHHLIGAGRQDEAVPLLLESARSNDLAPVKARALAEWALDVLPDDHPARARLDLAAAIAALRQGQRPESRDFATRAWQRLAPELAGIALPSAEQLGAALDTLSADDAVPFCEAWATHAATLLESEQEGALIELLPALIAHPALAGEGETEQSLVANLRQSLGLALASGGRSEEALPHLEAAVETATRRGDSICRGFDLTALAQALAHAGRIEEADQASVEAQMLGDSLGIMTLSLRGAFSHAEVLLTRGRLEEGAEIFEDVAQKAASWGHAEVHILAQQRLAQLEALKGRHDEAIAHYDSILPVVERLGHVNGLLSILTLRAIAYERSGRLDDAIADLTRAAAVARDAGRVPAMAWILVNLANDLLRAGDVGACGDHLRQVDEALAGVDADPTRLHMLRAWAQLELYLRRWPRAQERIDAGLAIDPDDPELLAKQIRLLCTQERPQPARALLDDKRERMARYPDPMVTKSLVVLDAEILLAEDRPAQATACIHEMIDRAEQTLPASLTGGAWWVASRAALRRGHLSTARRELEEALESMRVVSSTERTEAALTLAEVVAMQGDDQARELLAQTARAVGDAPEEEELRRRVAQAEARVEAELARASAAPGADRDAGSGFQQSVLEVLEEVVAGDHLNGLLPRLLDLTLELLEGERGILFLIDPPTGELAPAVQRGIDSDTALDAQTWSAGVLERSRGGELVLHDDAHNARELSGFQSIARFRIRSVAAVPLREAEMSVGVVYVDSRKRPLAISEASRSAFMVLARIFTRLIRQAATVDELRGEADRLRTEAEITAAAERRVEMRERWGELVGGSPPMLHLYGLLESLLEAAGRHGRLPRILITGETGTGKELVARELARRCERAERRFVAVSCADIPQTIMESELFGHKKGAFTGASADHIGYFEQADGGVLFLDEIGEAPRDLQAKLLRAIDRGEIQRVGDEKVRHVDVWLITATHQGLAAMVAAGEFRQDLYYRVREIEVHLPPLRERLGDVERLATHFLDAESRGKGERRLTWGARAALESHPWPGNVRELQGAITHAAFTTAEGPIGIERLPDEIQRAAAEAHVAEASQEPEQVAPIEDQIASYIRGAITRALEEHGGNRIRTARALGLTERKLRGWIARYAVPAPPAVRGRPPSS